MNSDDRVHCSGMAAPSDRSNGTSWDMDPVLQGRILSGYLRGNVSPWLALRKQLAQIHACHSVGVLITLNVQVNTGIS